MVTLKTMRNIQRWHEKEHPPVPFEDCWYCGREKAKCRSKIFRYTDRDEAFAEAKAMNEADNYVRPRVAYFCPWCGLYHHTTKLRSRRDAVERQRRKWVTQRELDRRAREREAGAGLAVDVSRSA